MYWSIKDGTQISIAFDEKYRYSMTIPDKEFGEDDWYYAFKEAEFEVGDRRIFGELISDEDEPHEIMKSACERLGIKYERTKI